MTRDSETVTKEFTNKDFDIAPTRSSAGEWRFRQRWRSSDECRCPS